MSNGDPSTTRVGYVLIVGHSGPDRDATEQALSAAGIGVASGSEADVLVAQDLMPPRLVVLDEPSDGEVVAILLRLRAHRALQGVPILILASRADIDTYSTAIAQGAAAYLVKPDARELVSVAQKLSGWVSLTDRTEKRWRIRRPLIMRVDVDVRSRKVKLPGHLMDVSGGGCRIELPETVARGEAIRIILHGYDASTYVALGAEVRWTREAAPGVHLLGCRFTGTTALLAGKLLGFVSGGTT